MNNLINIDFNKARQQADRLEVLANELENLTKNEYSSTMGQIQSGWRGEAADQFLNKGVILEDDINETIRRLRELINSIRSTVSKVEQAQKLADAVINKKNF